jgi:hypothetical protein
LAACSQKISIGDPGCKPTQEFREKRLEKLNTFYCAFYLPLAAIRAHEGPSRKYLLFPIRFYGNVCHSLKK